MQTVTSRDGTRIAYDRTGIGLRSSSFTAAGMAMPS